MKRALFLIPLVVIGVLLFLVSQQGSGSSSQTVSEDDFEIDFSQTPDEEISESELEALESARSLGDGVYPVQPDDARPATVSRLADGDSFDIRWDDDGDNDEVRLLGINAPEGDACFGPESRSILESFVGDQTIYVDTVQRDEFGRVLGDVWVNGRYVNAIMVEVGAALALSDDGNYDPEIAAAQDIAMENRDGLWDTCGADPDLTLSIADINFDARGPDNENKNGEWIEIRNDGSSSADLSGWSLRDESTRHRYSFPDDFVLDPSASVLVYSGCGTDGGGELYWCDEDPVWNNGGDTGFLVDPDGRFADTYTYSG